jgi:hypothetical protein
MGGREKGREIEDVWGSGEGGGDFGQEGREMRRRGKVCPCVLCVGLEGELETRELARLICSSACLDSTRSIF